MSIEDFITEEVKASGLNIRVTTHLDVDGYAKEVADEIDEQVFHAVAIRKGYVKERTCHMSRDLDGLSRRWWRCSDCDGVAPAPDKFSFCPYCGARVVSE